MNTPNRDIREIIRDEHLMRRQILKILMDRPQTVPEIACAINCPTHEVMFWLMGMRKYGHVAEVKEVTEEGYYRYRAVEREGG